MTSELKQSIAKDPIGTLEAQGIKLVTNHVPDGQDNANLLKDAELIIDEIRSKVGELLYAEDILQRDDLDPTAMALVKEDLETQRTKIRQWLTEIINRLGTQFILDESSRLYDFYETPTYRPDACVLPTYANFRAVLGHLQELRRQKKDASSLFGKYREIASLKHPGLENLKASICNGSSRLNEKVHAVLRQLQQIWNNDEVRLAYRKREHMTFIRQMKESRAVVETPTVIQKLNEIHQNLFGSKAFKVS